MLMTRSVLGQHLWAAFFALCLACSHLHVESADLSQLFKPQSPTPPLLSPSPPPAAFSALFGTRSPSPAAAPEDSRTIGDSPPVDLGFLSRQPAAGSPATAPLAASRGDAEADAAALLAFKAALPAWSANCPVAQWDGSVPLCLWDGITCSGGESGSVVALNLSDCGLTGNLSQVLASRPPFQQLITLDLARNAFSGQIPAEWAAPGAWPSLRALNLSENGLFGQLTPAWCSDGAFPSLQRLNLRGNKLSGGLPSGWGGGGCFPKLESLLLSNNSFAGGLPEQWGAPGSWPQLRTLDVINASLSGTLPAGWGRQGGWPQLTGLYLGRNSFNGSLPASWGVSNGSFPSLAVLSLVSSLGLSGTLPAEWGAAGSWPALETLVFAASNLSGTLPESWGAPAAWPSLRNFIIYSDELTGSLPSAWALPGALPRLTVLAFSGLKLTGTLPAAWGSPGAFSVLEELHLTGMGLTGSLPAEWGGAGAFPSLTFLEVSGLAGLSGPLPAAWGSEVAFRKLDALFLGNNSITGPLPLSWGTPPNAASGTNGSLPALNFLELWGNKLTGQLPETWGCGGSFAGLIQLQLYNTNVSGSLPDQWGTGPDCWPQLQALYISGLDSRRLTGTLPASWGINGSFPELVRLLVFNTSISGPLPSVWATAPGAWPRLATLALPLNELTGPLPTEWGARGAFPALQQVGLQQNRLSGTLPGEWGTLRGLRELLFLNLDSNRFEGPLPEAWGAAGAFPRVLMLSANHNNLTGQLPNWTTAPGNTLGLLTSLLLRGNRLTGQLPADLPTRLPLLSALDLTSNEFAGPLPREWGKPGAWKALLFLGLDRNRLSGSLPVEWGPSASRDSLPGLLYLSLYGNLLEGPLPATWGNVSSGLLDLSGNRLSGTLPRDFVSNANPLQVLALTNNTFEGELPETWNSTRVTILSVGGSEKMRGAIPLAWLSQEAFPNLLLLDFDRRLWASSLQSDAWKKRVCLNPELYTTDRFAKVQSELERVRLGGPVSFGPLKFTALLLNGLNFPEAGSSELSRRLSTRLQVTVESLCRNHNAVAVTAALWGATAAALVLLLAAAAVKKCCFGGPKAKPAAAAGQLPEAAGPPGKLAHAWKGARSSGTAVAAAGGLVLYWVDLATDVQVIAQVWGRWPAWPLLSALLLQFALGGALLWRYAGRFVHRLHAGAWAIYGPPACAISVVVLDVMALLADMGVPFAAVSERLDLAAYQAHKRMYSLVCRTLPTAVLQSVVYVMGNNPSTGLYFSDRLFVVSMCASSAQLVRVVGEVLWQSLSSDSSVFGHVVRVFRGDYLAPEAKFQQFQATRGAREQM